MTRWHSHSHSSDKFPSTPHPFTTFQLPFHKHSDTIISYPRYGPSKNLANLIPTASWLDHFHSLMTCMQRATNHHHFNLWVEETAAA
jgi:hypothetical protein